MQHKCKVFKCNLAFSTSKKYNIFQYYKIKIFHNYKKQYLYIRYSYSNNGNFPFDNFYKNILNNNNFHPNSIFIKTVKQNTHLIPPKRELNLEFYKYIDIYPSSDLPYINPNNETLFFPIETTYFITITFDPDKFSNYNDPNKEEDYILYILAQLYKNENIKNFYGCFEKHKTGKIHSHLIATIYDITPFRTSIKKSFTNNMRNLRAVDIGTYKLNKSIDYINKEEEYKKYYSNKNISPIKNI